MNFKLSTTSMALAIMVLSLISMTVIQQDAFASSGMSITATADRGSDTITVTGMTFSEYTHIVFTVVSPSGNNLVDVKQIPPDEDGTFSVEFKVGPTWTEDGFYTIQAKQGQGIFTLSVLVEVNDGMTEKTSETLSTLKGIFVPNLTNVAKDLGLALDAASFVNGDNRFTVIGTTDRVSQGINITVTAPNGNVVSVDQVTATLDGEFTHTITISGPLWKQNGSYTVTAYQNENPNYTDSIVVDIHDGVVV